MCSRLNEQLSIEEKKGFFKVDENAQYKARYGDALMPKYVPRLLSLNPGKHRGELLWDDWFMRQNLPGCAALVRRDLESIKEFDENQIAALRHLIIWRVPEYLYEKKEVKSCDDDMMKRFRSHRQA